MQDANRNPRRKWSLRQKSSAPSVVCETRKAPAPARAPGKQRQCKSALAKRESYSLYLDLSKHLHWKCLVRLFEDAIFEMRHSGPRDCADRLELYFVGFEVHKESFAAAEQKRDDVNLHLVD